mmetsp:Transcript_49816/g.121612  ORF Transcript_49816/g.121612 Transcript_49816/m.121612 type:complete len:206 (-) Transcript_49816:48-665(-)
MPCRMCPCWFLSTPIQSCLSLRSAHLSVHSGIFLESSGAKTSSTQRGLDRFTSQQSLIVACSRGQIWIECDDCSLSKMYRWASWSRMQKTLCHVWFRRFINSRFPLFTHPLSSTSFALSSCMWNIFEMKFAMELPLFCRRFRDMSEAPRMLPRLPLLCRKTWSVILWSSFFSPCMVPELIARWIISPRPLEGARWARSAILPFSG